MNEWEYTPAEDHGLSPSEALKSTWREPGLLSKCAHSLWLFLSQRYFRWYHRLEVHGAEHLPEKTPFVVVANHSSHLDAPAVIAALPRKYRSVAYPLAAGDAFFATKKGAWFGAVFLNALPVWRKRTAGHSLSALRERLDRGDVVYVLFPEGTRSRNGEMGSFKPGVGMLVAASTVPVVPCYIEGAFEALPPGAKWSQGTRMKVWLSKPVQFSKHSHQKDSWREIADSLESSVRKIVLGEKAPG